MVVVAVALVAALDAYRVLLRGPAEFVPRPRAEKSPASASAEHRPLPYDRDRAPPAVDPPPRGFPRCAINVYGLPRAFGNYVLPSLLRHVVKPNAQYGCDYFVHVYDVKIEAPGRSGQGGAINTTEVFALRGAVRRMHSDLGLPPVGVFYSVDDDGSFREARAEHVDAVSGRHLEGGENARNPYKPSEFTNATATNILKMWHSQTRVFELMTETGRRRSKEGAGQPYYERVAMLRSDVVFMSPVDIFHVTKTSVPVLDTANTAANVEGETPRPVSARTPAPASRSVLESWKKFMVMPGRCTMARKPRLLPQDWTPCKVDPTDCYHDFKGVAALVPGFASWPINDRFIAGPNKAVEVWATQRWNMYKEHVHTVLPTVLSKVRWRHNGIHDETLVALTVVPEIRDLGVDVVVDDSLFFLRVRADGTMLLYDSPYGFQEEKKQLLEKTLGRSCGKPYRRWKMQGDMSYLIECPVV